MLDRLGRAIERAGPGAVVLGLVLGVLVLAPIRMADSATRGPGSLDPSFGTGGKVTLVIPGPDQVAGGLVLRPDGRIVVARYTSNGTHETYDFFVAQFTSTGAADSSFGVHGYSTVDFSDGHRLTDDFGGALALQPDGKIILAGSARGVVPRGGTTMAVARINPDGSDDGSFGQGGRLVLDLADGINAIALRPDGRIVLAGLQRFTDFGIVQLSADGELDTSFGTNGESTVDFGGVDVANAVAVQPDGKIVVAGFTRHGGADDTNDFAVARLNTDGRPDNSFGTGGKVTVDFAGATDEAAGLALRPDGAIVVSGWTRSIRGVSVLSGDLAVAQLRPNGSLDGTFGRHGRTSVDLDSAEYGGALALRPDGEIVVAGNAHVSSIRAAQFDTQRISCSAKMKR
jgi:uncharacterized delta-60 repeat protein